MNYGVAMAIAGLLLPLRAASPPAPASHYPLSVDSTPQPGVPKGEVLRFPFDRSTVFPGTSRTVAVYVPAQYDGKKPACVYVGLDGLAFKAPIVFDNLISKHEMPVTIAIGIPDGTAASANPPTNPRFNRSFEFDGLNGNLGRFLLDELLPEVERHKTSDGRPILLSSDPNDRAAGGFSTGGIGAFTLAWERPDAFRRVFIAIGTFVGMRGGDRYPVLVRKTEPKPIRVFIQDGSNDGYKGNPEAGDWWLSNQAMQKALEFAGYQVEHVWGDGPHTTEHATAVFPDAMRWLWKDWPQPVTAGESQNTFLKDVLLPGEGWHAVAGNYGSAGALAANSRGEVFFRDGVEHRAWTIGADGKAAIVPAIKVDYAGMAAAPDDRLYVTDPVHATIVTYAPDGTAARAFAGIRGRNIVVSHGGDLYVTEPPAGGAAAGKVWLLKRGGEKVLLDGSLNSPSAIALSPDGRWLAVAESKTHWGYSYRIQPDGSVRDKQQFYWFHVPDEADDSGAGAWTMDREGRLYAATRMGVQIFDRNGRVRAILPGPAGRVTDISFGGSGFDTLYIVAADNKVYRRKLKVQGARPSATPLELPPGDNA